jgi:hypothetical protein
MTTALDDSSVVRRVADLEQVFRASASTGWKPQEVKQQSALAMLQHLSDSMRHIAFMSLFDRSACGECGEVAQIQQIARGWDLQLWCSTPTCSYFDLSLLNIELKPWGAPPHYSVAGLDVWRRRVSEESLVVVTNMHFPTEQCSISGCTVDCLHSSYRSKPTLPQVIAADPDGVDKLVLTDLPGDLSKVFGTRGWGYEIHGAEIRHIAEGIVRLTDALVPFAHDEKADAWDRRLLTLGVTALWVRTPPDEFRQLTESSRVRSWLDPDLVPLADEWVASHPKKP